MGVEPRSEGGRAVRGGRDGVDGAEGLDGPGDGELVYTLADLRSE
jgi:hypothetical protein